MGSIRREGIDKNIKKPEDKLDIRRSEKHSITAVKQGIVSTNVQRMKVYICPSFIESA